MVYTCDEFRIKDLSEFVPLIETKPFDIKEAGYCYYVLGKNCFVHVSYDKDTDEVGVQLTSPCMEDCNIFGGSSGIPFESVDLNALIENFIVFNHLNPRKMIFKFNGKIEESHHLAKNIVNILHGMPAEKPVNQIVNIEIYEKAMKNAKKACENEQIEVLESQAPYYDQ